MDVLAAVANDLPLRPGAVELIPTGLAVAIPEGWEIQVRQRSGLAVRHRVTILNTPATIDSDYRGEIMIPLVNLGNAAFIVERGMRIAQLVLSEVARIEWAEVSGTEPDSARHLRTWTYRHPVSPDNHYTPAEIASAHGHLRRSYPDWNSGRVTLLQERSRLRCRALRDLKEKSSLSHGLSARAEKIKNAWPDLHYSTAKGALILSPSPPRIAPSQLRLVDAGRPQ